MDYNQFSINTFIPELGKLLNQNFDAFKTYLDVFYDEGNGVVIKPVNTAGIVKGGTGQFVNLVVDNLTVKNQYTNLYGNSTTIDYDWYSTYIGADVSTRNASTGAAQEDSRFKYVDVNTSYIKMKNDVSLGLKATNVGQVVSFQFDNSTNTYFNILLDPSTIAYKTGQRRIRITAADSSMAFLKLICTNIDSSSLVCSWNVYEYGGNFSISKI